jgi:predicted RNA-binding protein with EMAP domain
MKVSLSWLKDYIPIKTDAEDLAAALTMAGLEVEAASDRYGYLDTVVVGRIVEVKPHPNADKLKLCSVDTGGQTKHGVRRSKYKKGYACAMRTSRHLFSQWNNTGKK